MSIPSSRLLLRSRQASSLHSSTPPLSKHNIALNQLPCQNTKQTKKETKYNYTKPLSKHNLALNECLFITIVAYYWYFDHNNSLQHLRYALKKKKILFGNFSQHGGGVFPNPKTFVNLPSIFLYAKFILRCYQKHVLQMGG